jgi:hypothetical protein
LALYDELPPELRRRLMAQAEAPALEQLGFFPHKLPAREKKAALALVAAASTPAVLHPEQPLDVALPPKLGGRPPKGMESMRDDPHFFILAEGEPRWHRCLLLPASPLVHQVLMTPSCHQLSGQVAKATAE